MSSSYFSLLPRHARDGLGEVELARRYQRRIARAPGISGICPTRERVLDLAYVLAGPSILRNYFRISKGDCRCASDGLRDIGRRAGVAKPIRRRPGGAMDLEDQFYLRRNKVLMSAEELAESTARGD